MSKNDIFAKAERTVHRVGFKLKKHSPEILVAAGIAGVIASTVMACKATTKINDILNESKENIEKVHEGLENHPEEYNESDSKKDLTIIYAQTGIKLVKLYTPAFVVGTLSITSILASNNILKKRNIAISSAYAAVSKGFKDYRGRVVERYGEQVDKELRHNIKAKKIEETVTDENGKEKKVKNTVNVSELEAPSDFARFFDAASRCWDKDPNKNLMFLKAQQNYANDLLVAQGHLYLNEVYDMLDIPRTKEGQYVGWIYDEKNPRGDNYVDFGIYDIHRESNRDFVNGYEPVILLDFNVDGTILDLM